MKEKTIYALGFFDGVHLGHQALMQACRHLAQRTGSNTGVATFSNHPDGLVSGKFPDLINTRQDRGRLLRGYRMEKLIELPFDEKLMHTRWPDFLQQLLDGDAAGFVCGSDFRFGAKGEGTAQKLESFCKERKLPYAIVPQQLLDGVRVSSTHIRQLLTAGNLKDANRFLGHPYTLSGQVVAGKQLGRTIGAPTANLIFPEGLVIPRRGVYAAKAAFDGQDYGAVVNIGTRPTVNGKGVLAEAHLLDFAGDLYGKQLSLSFLEFLRPEQKFDSLEELKVEIEKNALQTRKILEKH